jgi:hypothetical protein
MASRDNVNSIKIVQAIGPQAIITGNTTSTGATLDTQGFESCTCVVVSGTLTDGTQTPSFEEGDQSNMSDAATVAAGDLIGTMAAFASTDDNVTRKIGYKGNKRYFRVKLTGSGQTTGGYIGAYYVQGNAKNNPVA